MSFREWKKYTLGELAEIKYGKDHKHLGVGNIPVYGSGGVMRYADTALYDKESILIPRKGTLGNLFYVDTPFWSVDTIFYTKIKDRANAKFLFYLLKTLDLASMNVGSAVPSLTTEILNNVEVNVPSKETQQRIASILSSLDDKIALNRQTNQTLEAMAQTLFKEMCLPKGDVLPEGWRVEIASKLFDVKDGTHNSPKQTQEGKYLITSKHLISDSTIDFKAAYKISIEDFVEINRRSKVDNYDILYSMIGTIGNILLVNERNIDFAIKNIGLFKTSQKKELAYFFYLFLKSDFAMQYIKERHSGSTQQYITLKTLREMPIKIPPFDIIKDFNNQMNSIFEQIKNNIYENQTLTALRDSLLPKLMKGEIEV